MTAYRDRDFIGEDVLLDGDAFTGCTFQQCRLVVKAEKSFTFSANRLQNSQVLFLGAAKRTIKFIQSLYHEGGAQGPQTVEQFFQTIRDGTFGRDDNE